MFAPVPICIYQSIIYLHLNYHSANILPHISLDLPTRFAYIIKHSFAQAVSYLVTCSVKYNHRDVLAFSQQQANTNFYANLLSRLIQIHPIDRSKLESSYGPISLQNDQTVNVSDPIIFFSGIFHYSAHWHSSFLNGYKRAMKQIGNCRKISKLECNKFDSL